MSKPIHFMTMIGPEISHDSLPVKLRPYCPMDEDFTVFSAHQFEFEDESTTANIRVFSDPSVQKNVTYGIFLSLPPHAADQ